MYKFLKGLVGGAKSSKPVRAHRIALMGRPHSYQAPEQTTILRAAVDAGIPFPHNCGEGFCGSCRCRVVSGRYALTGDIQHLVDANDQQLGYTLACKTRALSDVTVSFEPQAPALPGTLTTVAALTEHLWHLRVELAAPLIYRNGQFVNLLAAGLGPRAYSIVTPYVPGSRVLDFHVSTKGGGAFATWVSQQARVGDRIELDGPHGTFLRPAGRRHLVLVAGGSGAGVLWGMVADQRELDVTVLAVTNRHGHFYLREGFAALASAHRIDLREVGFDAEADDGYAALAREAAAVAQAHRAAGAEPVFLICGSEALVRSTTKALVAAGVPATDVLSDTFVGREALSLPGQPA